MTRPTPAIQVKDLTRRFRDLVAVEDLAFSVNPGELFGLVGPDGAGKTTTLRMLAGVLRPSSGDAIINGISVVQHPEQVKHEIAYMSQRFGLYTDLTVLENLHFYADLYQVPKSRRTDRIERLFQFSNLKPFKDRLAGKLSGGMKQKLGLSCALIHQPNILLLDEPTFGVDPISRRDLWLIVHDMVAQGVTAIVSTAYMDEAERFDRIALLQQGRLLAIGKPEALQQGLEGEVIQVHVERVREARDLIANLSRVRSVAVFGDRLHVMIPSAERDGPVVEAALREAGFSQIEWHLMIPSMEDVFIDHVTKKGAS
jgi:ABC-2 type transport system ATP-binding protein